MYVHKLSLKHYRNFESLNIELDPGINIFYGQNAQGKTNLLESIYLCARGRSQRLGMDKDLIMFGKQEAKVQILIGDVFTPNLYEKVDIHLKRDKPKGIAINGVAIKKLGNLFGVLLSVIFSPEDLQLVKAGPSERRRFMDMELCQLSQIYYYDLGQYYHVLKQRNNLLKNLKKNPSLKETLFIWDEPLVNNGIKIIKNRHGFIKKINSIANQIHFNITDGKEDLKIIYKPNINENDFKEKLEKSLERDILLGSTQVGIHKDDLSFFINDIDVRVYGSQGQQRTASLSVKLAEIELIKERKNNIPVLLLDDVMSELDASRQSYLLNSIKDIQTIITCTGVEDILNKIETDKKIYKVEKGNIVL